VITNSPLKLPRHEHSVPWFWPLATSIEMQKEGLKIFQNNMHFIAETEKMEMPPPPEWASPNRILLKLATMRLRDFSHSNNKEVPILIDAPYAGHSSTIVDYAKGQSLVEVLLSAGLKRVLATDWKSATPAMRDFDIDKYLQDLNTAIDHLGGQVALVGLCQGGWLSAMYTCRFPEKVVSLVLAGAPIDTDAGEGPIKKIAHQLPLTFYQELVALGNGRMLGQYMLAGWKNMHPGAQYLGKFIDLYEHIQDGSYVKRTEQFERWYENPIDLPGRYYLQAIQDLFKENRFSKGEFIGLGQRLSLGDIECPTYLLAGKDDEITPPAQVFAAEHLLGTPKTKIVKQLAPGGHIGLFMGSKTLKHSWPKIGKWLLTNGLNSSVK
jgi:poly(3-hydroxybutyrate) depolymerase